MLAASYMQKEKWVVLGGYDFFFNCLFIICLNPFNVVYSPQVKVYTNILMKELGTMKRKTDVKT